MHIENLNDLKERREKLKKECEELTGSYMQDLKKNQEDLNLKNKMMNRMAELKGMDDAFRAFRTFIQGLDFIQCGDYDTLKEVLLNELKTGGADEQKTKKD